jgi:CheY-like chemotaxis protein
MINLHLHTLSVDDEPDIREIIDLALGLDPLFVVRECPSGREALRDAVEWRPDLILLDVMMPIMDGVTTLAQLRAERRTAMIPVVFMTARAQTHERERFMSLGAAGVIAKPFDPMQLPALVRKCLSAGATPADDYLGRLDGAHTALSAFRAELAQPRQRTTLARVRNIAQMLADASRLNGFAGIGLEAAALEDAVEGDIAGRAAPMQIEHAIDRVLARIAAT